jgi:hypothetical protein
MVYKLPACVKLDEVETGKIMPLSGSGDPIGTYRIETDGTITLNVHVVYPYAGDSNVYMHDVTVRPLSDGGFQYVSNYIVSEEENNNITWHTPRLTEDEWNDIYGGQ